MWRSGEGGEWEEWKERGGKWEGESKWREESGRVEEVEGGKWEGEGEWEGEESGRSKNEGREREESVRVPKTFPTIIKGPDYTSIVLLVESFMVGET